MNIVIAYIYTETPPRQDSIKERLSAEGSKTTVLVPHNGILSVGQTTSTRVRINKNRRGNSLISLW